MTAIKYIVFAIIATLLNLAFQYLSFSIYSGPADLYVAMFAGTLAGLVSKYVLDKQYIFYHKPQSRTHDAKCFALYTSTGIGTTLIFWVTEIGFDHFIASDNAKYYGAVTGLAIGYTLKFFLDKHFVFRETAT